MDMAINHVIFNTGRQELVDVRKFGAPVYDRVGMKWLIEHAKKPGGVALDDKVVLRLSEKPTRYTAFLAYESAAANRIFLYTAGARTPEASKELWLSLCANMSGRYAIATPLKSKPRSPLVVDVPFPCHIPDVMAVLYAGRYYDFSLQLGRAMLYPESLEAAG